ncbi:MAG: TrkH family potassium uptake protein [Alphaproteobacteria bacterium]
MVHFASIFYLIGWLLLILSGFSIFPAAIDFFRGCDDYKVYLFSGVVMVFLGALFIFSTRSEEELEFDKRDSFVLTVMAWLLVIIFSAIPFLLAGYNFSCTDSFFETVSGLTTTGATVLVKLDQMPWGILLWRSILQWLGGIGIVVMALTVLTEMRIGGMELFQTESSEKSEKFLPRVAQIAKIIFWVYLILTVLCFACLWACGMTWFDALCHSFTTVSTGGFSTHDASITFFNSFKIEGILTVFMFLGGITQLSFIHLWDGRWKKFFEDSQFQSYTKILFAAVLALIAWKLIYKNEEEPLTIIVKTLFNLTSIMTTTGFESTDYTAWGGFAIILVFFLPFIGGSTGSTSGGIKVFRCQVLWEVAVNQLRKIRRPHGIYLPKYNGREISKEGFNSVSAFFIFFLISFAMLALILAFLGLDAMTALSASASMLTNVGPGIGEVIGPTKTYTHLTDSVKWVLMVGMLLGRLELLTLYVLFLKSFWKD